MDPWKREDVGVVVLAIVDEQRVTKVSGKRDAQLRLCAVDRGFVSGRTQLQRSLRGVHRKPRFQAFPKVDHRIQWHTPATLSEQRRRQQFNFVTATSATPPLVRGSPLVRAYALNRRRRAGATGGAGSQMPCRPGGCMVRSHGANGRQLLLSVLRPPCPSLRRSAPQARAFARWVFSGPVLVGCGDTKAHPASAAGAAGSAGAEGGNGGVGGSGVASTGVAGSGGMSSAGRAAFTLRSAARCAAARRSGSSARRSSGDAIQGGTVSTASARQGAGWRARAREAVAGAAAGETRLHQRMAGA